MTDTEQIYKAWQAVGADLAGLKWDDFVAALAQPEQEPVALPEKWHHPECEGECIACLIERVVQEAYSSQGLGYLHRHLTSPPAQRKPHTA